ncbi:MAG: Imidazole glycerol phosphate synthase subunit HisF [Pseudomonadota bacterium]
MLRKRLIGVVTVRGGIAVQSFGYRRHLPMGRPEVVAENLDRWGADEILISCIDRTRAGLGPDFDLIGRVAGMGLSTPLIYAGGVRHAEDAVRAARLGADRVMADALLLDRPDELESASRALGVQALIGHVPVRVHHDGLLALDYRSGRETPLDDALRARASLDSVSELMLTDWTNEGRTGGFDESIPALCRSATHPLILLGGLSDPLAIRRMLSLERVVAVGVGNTLSYREHAIQHLRQRIALPCLRAARFPEGARP